MITVTGFKVKQTKDGRDLTLLELTGNVTLVQSQNSGKWYATTPKCYMPSTFDEKTAESLIGTKLEGRIARVETEPYTIVDENTGEELCLAFRWGYVAPGAIAPMEETLS